MENFSKYFVLVILTLVSSCTFSLKDSIWEEDLKESKLQMTGPSSVIAFACSEAITLALVGQNDESSPIILNPGSGSFHLLNDCSDSPLTSIDIPVGQSSVLVYYQNSNVGSFTLSTSPLIASMNIEVVSHIPAYSFARDAFTIIESGDSVGLPVTINRTVPGDAENITFEIVNLAGGLTDITPGQETQIISFSPSEVSKVVNIPLTVLPTFSGDRFYVLKISALSGTGTLGDRTEVVLNLMEEELVPEKFFFSKPLYSVNENEGFASIHIQRKSDTSTLETITLSSINGSASDLVDFIGTTQIITFNPGQDEVWASIPVINNASLNGNRSFYLELKDSSPGILSTRIWSTAKVRILDDEEIILCDETQTMSFGGGSGLPGDPYLICNINQLALVSTSLSSHFKLTKDFDIEGLSMIPGTFSGVFDGNEYILKNLKFASASPNDFALFERIGGANAIIKGINLVQASISSNGGNVSGIVVYDSHNYSSMNNNLVSGIFQTPIAHAAGIIAHAHGDNDPLVGNYNNFVHGSIYGGYRAGGIIGMIHNTGEPDILIRNSYVAGVIASDQSAGGIVGAMEYTTSSSLKILQSHAKGFVMGVSLAEHTGGILGSFSSTDEKLISLDFENVHFEGTILNGKRMGGLIGAFNCYGVSGTNCRIKDSSVRGKTIFSPMNEGYIDIGGAFGFVGGNQILNVEGINSRVNVDVAATGGGQNVGGVIGRLVTGDGNVILKNFIQRGEVKASNPYTLGGVIGLADINSNQFSMENFHIEAQELHGVSNVGGILGAVYADLNAPGAITLENAIVNVDSIIGTGNQIGGAIGYLEIDSNVNFEMNNAQVEASISTTGNNVGGITGESQNYGVFQLTRSSFKGEIFARGDAGGLLGGDNDCNNFGEFIIEESFSDAQINVSDVDAGGLIAGLYNCKARISNSYAKGTLITDDYGAGLISWYGDSPTQETEITNSYAWVDITNPGSHVQGLACRWSAPQLATASQSFFVQEAGGINDGVPYNETPGALPKTLSQLGTLDLDLNASGWDFSNVWEYKVPNAYPTLRNNPE